MSLCDALLSLSSESQESDADNALALHSPTAFMQALIHYPNLSPLRQTQYLLTTFALLCVTHSQTCCLYVGQTASAPRRLLSLYRRPRVPLPSDNLSETRYVSVSFGRFHLQEESLHYYFYCVEEVGERSIVTRVLLPGTLVNMLQNESFFTSYTGYPVPINFY